MLSTNQKGAIAETSIMRDAIRHGFDVFAPVNEGVRSDLIFNANGVLHRVQCKWANLVRDAVAVRLYSGRRARDGIRRSHYSKDEVDVIAAYCEELDQCFYVPSSRFSGRTELRLRIDPARNNQRTGINWAAEYNIGAIAQLGERVHGMHEVVGSIPTSSTT